MEVERRNASDIRIKLQTSVSDKRTRRSSSSILCGSVRTVNGHCTMNPYFEVTISDLRVILLE